MVILTDKMTIALGLGRYRTIDVVIRHEEAGIADREVGDLSESRPAIDLLIQDKTTTTCNNVLGLLAECQPAIRPFLNRKMHLLP